MTSRSIDSDPLRNFRFRVYLNNTTPGLTTMARMGFMAMSGLAVNNEVIPYREGGNNTTTRKMPGQSEFGPITLTRGLMAAPIITSGSQGGNVGTNELYLWFTQIFSVNIGKGFGPPGGNFRIGVTIDVMAHPITSGTSAVGLDPMPTAPIKARFVVWNCWPMGYSFSDLEAGGNAVFIETLTLAHEGWQMITAPTNAPGDYVPSSVQGLAGA
jgi:phage tail-like protein